MYHFSGAATTRTNQDVYLFHCSAIPRLLLARYRRSVIKEGIQVFLPEYFFLSEQHPIIFPALLPSILFLFTSLASEDVTDIKGLLSCCRGGPPFYTSLC